MGRKFPEQCTFDNQVIFVLVDRDIKRRCACSRAGYAYRLQQYFERGTKTGIYSLLVGMDVEEARRLRSVLASRVLGRKFSSRTALDLPHAYLLPKAKCFGGSFFWECKKDHEHDRCIVSAPRDAVSRFLRRVARAICVVAKNVGLLSTAVGKLSNLSAEMQKKCAQLLDTDLVSCQMCAAEKTPAGSVQM